MTINEIRKAANAAGDKYMRENAEVPAPGCRWTKNAYHASMQEMHRLARLYKIDLFKLPNERED